MRSNPSRSSFTFRYTLVAGAVLLTGWNLSVSHTATSGALQQVGSTHQEAAGLRTRSHWFEFGRASWYGHAFQGQTTASGEAFDMYRMTCAHRSLPIGALVRVTNLRNHKSVVVRVNDRGPMVHSRIVDLSYAAARVIGFRGMTRVRLDLIDASPSAEEVARIDWPEKLAATGSASASSARRAR